MLENMSPNQRLVIALVAFTLFFIGYTALFPPKNIDNNQTVATQPTQQTSETITGTAIENRPKLSSATEVPLAHQALGNDRSSLVTVYSHNFILKVDSLGRIASKQMLQDKFDVEEHHNNIVPASGIKSLELRFVDPAIDKEAATTSYSTSVSEINVSNTAQKVVLTQHLQSVDIVKTLRFYGDGHYDINISLSKPLQYALYLGERPKQGDNQFMVNKGAMVYYADGKSKIFEDEDVSESAQFENVHLISSFDQYFANIYYGFGANQRVYIEGDRQENPIVYTDGMQQMQLHGYIGPKAYKILEAINPELVNAIEYGWFTFAARPLFAGLMYIEQYVGNWGWAIVIITILIRIVLYPLTYKGMVSMAKLKEAAPKIKEIQQKHKGDPQRMNAAVMEFYKKEGANPIGGCLPLLLQIPVFFTIYRVLLNAVELKGAEWILWIDDLAKMDPTFVLPILMGASMYFQQKITPSNFTDPMQEKIFKYLPIIFTFFFVTFPAGLVLYWFTNNLLSIAQQYVVNRKFQQLKLEKKN